MLIKSLTLDNFRIFAGSHTVNFSVDKDKNVTIIMGDNGAGKTTFAQAFTWCLYGDTTFKSKDLLSFSVRDAMSKNQSETVSVSLTLVFNEREYTLKRSQQFTKVSDTKVTDSAPAFVVSYKDKSGQVTYVSEEKAKNELIEEIVPKSVSDYFFFDGERVERMGQEIQDGKGKNFKKAVDNLLGLSAISNAIHHLSGTPAMVIGSYEKDYDQNKDQDHQNNEREIDGLNDRLGRIAKDLSELEEEKEKLEGSIRKYDTELNNLRQYAKIQADRESYILLKDASVNTKESRQTDLLNRFKADQWRFFVAPYIDKAIRVLEESDVDYKSSPLPIDRDIIKYITDHKRCICGNCVEFGSEAYDELMSLREKISKNSLPGEMKRFVESNQDFADFDILQSLPKSVTDCMDDIREAEGKIVEYSDEIQKCSNMLLESKDTSEIEEQRRNAQRNHERNHKRTLELTEQKGKFEKSLSDCKRKRDKLETTDKTNQRVRRDKGYAEEILKRLNGRYSQLEKDTRLNLQKEINDIFKEFFDGSLSLNLDDNYNVRVINRDSSSKSHYVETSEGQTVSVIFAFIAGVMRLSTSKNFELEDSPASESYPLVMDAPMSKLDKKRIKAVCEVMPNVAQQAIIMIKDTDGELAREYLTNRIGVEYDIVSVTPERESKLEEKRS